MSSRDDVKRVLDAVAERSLSVEAALEALGTAARTGDVRFDADRKARRGLPEVVFAEGKTADAVVRALRAAHAAHGFGMATRVRPDQHAVLCDALPALDLDPLGRTATLGTPPAPHGDVVVITGGTSDGAVAREAMACLHAFGVGATLIEDVGVAGLHRLLAEVPRCRRADHIIAVAGFEAALPTVLAGLLDVPVTAVPTSVGTGVAAGGHVALNALLASCAGGVAVVNIDSGFGAAAHAALCVHRAARGVPA